MILGEDSQHPVLLTGGYGFLGSAIAWELKARKAAFCRFRRDEFDLLRRDAVDSLFVNTSPSIVIHCAGVVGGIGANMREPGRFFHDNLVTGVNVVEAARRFGVKKLVMIGTVCSYPEITPTPFSEDSLWNGYPEPTNAPYGIAKRALLTMCQAYRQQYDMNCIFLMPTNMYGPGDHFEERTSHVIPALIRRFTKAREAGEADVTVWGDGSSTRDFLYVEDGARMIVDATGRYDSENPMNLGTGDEISILELARMIADRVGYNGRLVFDRTGRNGQPRRVLSTLRSHAFGFVPRIRLQEGLERTIAWYLRNCATVVNSAT